MRFVAAPANTLANTLIHGDRLIIEHRTIHPASLFSFLDFAREGNVMAIGSDYFKERFEHNCEILKTLSTNWVDVPFTDFGDSDDQSICLLAMCGIVEIQLSGECWNPDDTKLPKHYFKALVSGINWLHDTLPGQVKAAIVGNDGPELFIQLDTESPKARLTVPIGINAKFALLANQQGEVRHSFGQQVKGRAGVKITGTENQSNEVLKRGPYAVYGSKEEKERVHQEWKEEAVRIRKETPDIKTSEVIARLQRTHQFINKVNEKPISDMTIRRAI